MITLYSYPELFGVADNNGYGLKVFAFLKLSGLAFIHEHIFDAASAPRGQLPYIIDGDAVIGDSDMILSYLQAHHASPPLPSSSRMRASARRSATPTILSRACWMTSIGSFLIRAGRMRASISTRQLVK